MEFTRMGYLKNPLVRNLMSALGASIAIFGCSSNTAKVDADPSNTGVEVISERKVDPSFLRRGIASVSLNTETFRGGEEAERVEFEGFRRRIKEVMLKQTSRRGQPLQRGFHAKNQTCLFGRIHLYEDRSNRSFHGVFSQRDAKPSDLWVRFSNGVGWTEEDDSVSDVRGMALKIMGVPGEKLMDDEKQTQDFLMTNGPTPIGANAADFMEFAEANSRSKLAVGALGARHPITMGRSISRTFRSVPSLAREQFWSGVPYRMGKDSAMKFTVIPIGCPRDFSQKLSISQIKDKKITLNPLHTPLGKDDGNFLKQDLVAAAHEGFCYEFNVQFQLDPEKNPIEDASVNWDEYTVNNPIGIIEVPKQFYWHGKQDKFCDNLSFNPWHGVEDHRPLGHMNRARRVVYKESAKYSLRPNYEPTSFEGFDQLSEDRKDP